MGEARMKDEAVERAVAQLQAAAGQPPPLQLRMDQAAAMFAMDLCVMVLAKQGETLRQFGQKDAADVLTNSAEHINKFQVRFVADAQRSIVLASPVIPGKL